MRFFTKWQTMKLERTFESCICGRTFGSRDPRNEINEHFGQSSAYKIIKIILHNPVISQLSEFIKKDIIFGDYTGAESHKRTGFIFQLRKEKRNSHFLLFLSRRLERNSTVCNYFVLACKVKHVLCQHEKGRTGWAMRGSGESESSLGAAMLKMSIFEAIHHGAR